MPSIEPRNEGWKTRWQTGCCMEAQWDEKAQGGGWKVYLVLSSEQSVFLIMTRAPVLCSLRSSSYFAQSSKHLAGTRIRSSIEVRGP